MKIRMLFLALLCLSQTYAQVTNPLDSQMVALTQNLNFTEVTSGILFDRGAQTAHPDGYNGSVSADTIFSFDDWWLQYAAMYTGNVNATNTLAAVGTWKPQALALVDSGVVPLMVMNVAYHRLISDSVLFFNSFNLVNDQLYDISGRTQSPYEAHQLVSFSPRKSNWYDDLSVDFQMNSEFIISNTSKTLLTVEVDFGRGAGYQTVSLNSKIKVTYTQYGTKWLKLKLTYTDGSFYHAICKFTLHSDGSDQPKSLNGNYDDVVQIEHPTLSNHGAELQIDYGCNNEGEIRKPYIYVEGFNPEEFGDLNYNRLWENDSLTDRDDLYPSWLEYQFEKFPTTGYRILDELQVNNYDIIYVDFEKGAGNIIYNAQTLMEVIKWVNEQKAANCSSYPNTLVGYSMGGIVARLALTYMEDDEDAGTGPPHNVSYYVSVDSPHLGANIPRGLIASITDAKSYEFLGMDVTDGLDDVQEAYDVLFSPAARQMLYYSGEGDEFLVTGHGPTYTAFQNTLQTQGMPTKTIKNFAISKGNSSGNDQGFGSQNELIDIDLNTLNATGCLVNVENDFGDAAINAAGYLVGISYWVQFGLFAHVGIDIDAMPGYTTQAHRIYKRRARIFFFLIPLQWENYETKAKTVYSFDGEQGGKYPFDSFGGSEFLENAVANDYSPCIDFFHPAFNFIPTASALNIPELKYQPWVAFDPDTYLNGDASDFDKAFLLDPTKYPLLSDAPSNESHLDLTPSNVFPFSEFITPDYDINDFSSINDFTFNFGFGELNNEQLETNDRIARLITIGSSTNDSGEICVNCSGRVHVIDDNSFPTNSADLFSVELSRNCGGGAGRLRINSNGTLKIGENANKTGILTVRDNSWIELNDGIVEIREGSKLIIDSGAELRLNGGQVRVFDGGELIVKPGGLLIFEDGVTLELNGDDAQLALGGRTHVGDNAAFGFTYQGNESGYIRLLEEGHWGERFSTGINATVAIEGEGIGDKVLHLEQGADFWEYIGTVPGTSVVSNGFQDILIQDGDIEFEYDARFVAIAPVYFNRVKMYGSIWSRGVESFQQTKLRSSDIQTTKIHAKLHYFGNGLLDISACDFDGCQIEITGRGYNIQYSDFFNSTIHSSMGSVTSRFINCTHMAALDNAIVDVSPTDLIVSGSQFDDSFTGLFKEKGNLRVKCSDFTNFGKAIELYPGASLNMSTRLQGGYNFFNDNDYNVFMNNAASLVLNDGYNELYDGNLANIYGSLDVPHIPAPPPISLSFNTWTPASSSSPPNPLYPDLNEFYAYIDGGTSPLHVFSWHFGSVAPVVPCGEFDAPPVPDPVGKSNNTELSLHPFITTILHFDSVRFDLAVEQATTLISENDSAGTNATAAEMYHEILSAEIEAVNDSVDNLVRSMRWNMISVYKTLIEQMIADDEIELSENQTSFSSPVQA